MIELFDNIPNHPDNETIRSLVDEWKSQKAGMRGNYYSPELATFTSYTAMKGEGKESKARFSACIVNWLIVIDRIAQGSEKGDDWPDIWGPRRLLGEILKMLMRSKLPLTTEEIKTMLGWCTEQIGAGFNGWNYPLAPLLSLIERQTELDSELMRQLGELGRALNDSANGDTKLRQIQNRINVLTGSEIDFPIITGEFWADTAIADISKLSAQRRSTWIGLLNHCKTATGAQPKEEWLDHAKTYVRKLDSRQVACFLSNWFSLTVKKRNHPFLSPQEWNARCALEIFDTWLYAQPNFIKLFPVSNAVHQANDPWGYLENFNTQPEVITVFGDKLPDTFLPASPPPQLPVVEDLMIIQTHMDLLVGLAWVSGRLKDSNLTRSLAELAVSMYRKVPGKGPRAVKVGNASIAALTMIGDAAALGQLALLRVKIKFGGAQNAIRKATTTLAKKLGISEDDLEELSVPHYGMTKLGCVEQPIGEFTAQLKIVDSRRADLVWIREDGKHQKSIPAMLKTKFTDELKQLKSTKKDIEKMLPAQSERLDNLFLQLKSWPLRVWRERYLDHPLVGTLSRRLIWNFSQAEITSVGVWLDGKIVDRAENELFLDEKNTTVTLWHPLDSEPEIVIEWREVLRKSQITQPFRQAHREIYLLTPAEEETSIYSNRFAAHLLKQHQFSALCAARGWQNDLRMVIAERDTHYGPATRYLPASDSRAEYWVEGVETGDDNNDLETGAYPYITSDQIRFYHQLDPSVPVRLSEIAPLVFSEVMRDVDLFVSVSSVGSDPNWLDNPHSEHHRGYWQHFSFGDLSATAKTRKTVLEQVIPKLKIAAACSFRGNFLIVQGILNRYKIHLGSGNILIMPQERYLCIVPTMGLADKATERLYLPFEGDRLLSVILSEAFMLAADDKISDPTISTQL